MAFSFIFSTVSKIANFPQETNPEFSPELSRQTFFLCCWTGSFIHDRVILAITLWKDDSYEENTPQKLIVYLTNGVKIEEISSLRNNAYVNSLIRSNKHGKVSILLWANRGLRKSVETRTIFPNEEAVFKLIFLTMHHLEAKWTMPIRDWVNALNQLHILFPRRLPNSF